MLEVFSCAFFFLTGDKVSELISGQIEFTGNALVTETMGQASVLMGETLGGTDTRWVAAR
jgi:hypothetical protein